MGREQHGYRHHLPKRIILVTNGQSEGNLDTSAYTTTPDYRIPLTSLGIQQARDAGRRIREVVSERGGNNQNWKVYFYVSPYERTRSTLREIGRSFSRKRILGVREECRIRQQDFGNFQVAERMRVIKLVRTQFGRFFFRFPDGESASDVYDRISSFLESMWRDIVMRLDRDDDGEKPETNIVIVSHGLSTLVFLMKWFKWTAAQFERLSYMSSCDLRVMQLGPNGEYSLMMHHSVEELQSWGLSPEMIADQQRRASPADDQGKWSDDGFLYLNSFFDDLAESSGDDEDGRSSPKNGTESSEILLTSAE